MRCTCLLLTHSGHRGRKVLGLSYRTNRAVRGAHAAARFHHASRRGSSRVAVRGACTAGHADAPHRRACWRGRRLGHANSHRRISAGAAAIGMGRRPKRSDRRSCGQRRCRPHSQICGGISRARARCHSDHRIRSSCSNAEGDPHCASRVHECCRSSRRRLRQ